MKKRKWGRKSKEVYDTLDGRLKILADRILHEVSDISLIHGFRDEEEQNYLFDRGVSTLRWPDSKHNQNPSKAFDFQPYPFPYREEVMWGALSYVAGRAMAIAEEEGFRIRWGGDWNMDGDMTNQDFYDLFHIELA